MRRRIALLVGATTSAIILGFVVPLGLLVRQLAHDRAMTAATDEANTVALLVSNVHDDPAIVDVVATMTKRAGSRISVVAPDAASQVVDPTVTDDIERARAGASFTRVIDDGVAIVRPVVTDDGTYVVRGIVSTAQLRQGVGRAWGAIGGLGAVLLMAALGLANFLGKRVSTPVTDLVRVAHRLHDGEIDARATPSGPPETVELGEALNQLAERVSELLMAERAAVGDLAHRLRTPVTALRLDAESVADPLLATRLQEHVGRLQRAIDAIVRDARRPLQHTLWARCDARAAVAERMFFWSALAEDQGRPVRVELPAGTLPAAVDAVDLTDVLDVLVDNVFAHTAEEVGFAVRLRGIDGAVELIVSDTGPGIPPDGGGAHRQGSTGLGLQIARRTVTAIGGSFEVVSGPGTTVTVTLPTP